MVISNNLMLAWSNYMGKTVLDLFGNWNMPKGLK